MAAEVAQVLPGDQVPHVDGRVVAGAEQDPTGNGNPGRREAGVRRRRLVLAQLLVRPDVPKPTDNKAVVSSKVNYSYTKHPARRHDLGLKLGDRSWQKLPLPP